MRFDRALIDADEVNEIVDRYRTEQEAKGKPCTIAGIGYALGVHRDTVRNYATGQLIPELKEDGSNLQEVEKARAVASAVHRATLLCDADLQDTLMEHGGNNGAMFYAKNCLGYVDRMDVSATIQTPIYSGSDALQD